MRFSQFLYHYERWAAALFLVLVLALPRISPVLTAMLPNIDTMVICTGDAFLTVTLNADGTPAEHEEIEENHCTLADLAQTAPRPMPFWQKLALQYGHAFSIREHAIAHQDRLNRLEPARAPPVLI